MPILKHINNANLLTNYVHRKKGPKEAISRTLVQMRVVKQTRALLYV